MSICQAVKKTRFSVPSLHIAPLMWVHCSDSSMSLFASFSSKRRQNSLRPHWWWSCYPCGLMASRGTWYLFMANKLRRQSDLAVLVIQGVSDSLHQQVLSSLNAWDGTDEGEQFRWAWREENLGITVMDPWNGVHSGCLNEWQLVNNSNLKISSFLGVHGFLHELTWLPGITMISYYDKLCSVVAPFSFFFFK